MAGSSDPLQQRGDPVRRSNLAHQIDMADVDSELERCRCNERAQPSRLESRLGIEPRFFRQAAVMGGDRVLADPLAQMTRQPLRHPARIHEDQGRLVRRDERREAIVVLLPHFVRHHRVQRGARNLHAQIDPPGMPFIDDRALVAMGGASANQEARHLLDRFLGSRQPQTQKRALGNLLQSFE